MLTRHNPLDSPRAMQTVVELPEFQKRSAELLAESECASIINYLAAHPLAGDIMQGTGGIRKRQQSLKITEVVMNSAFESIRQGLVEAVEFSQGEKSQALVHTFQSIDVKNIRKKIGMSQSEFAAAFGISVSTLRHWERGDRTPQGPALVLLKVVAKEPQAVLRALSQ